MASFLEKLRELRWDDHRYYHHSRINQALHLLSATSFVVAYITVFKHPAFAVLLAWLFGMTSRQAGHFFFEPRDYDKVNDATHEYKESIKVGYNLQRKVVLMALWFLSPLVFFFDPTVFGIFPPHQNTAQLLDHIALLWLAIGTGGLLFRTVHLFFLRDVKTGLAWMTKILTDPFHDIMLYHKAPLHLLRGELIDPMHHVNPHAAPAHVQHDTEIRDAGLGSTAAGGS
jgi:hypothetical protein